MEKNKRKLAVLLFFWAGFTWAQSPEDIARKAENKLRSLESFQARFTQIYYSASVTTPLKEFGRVYYQKPGWMRWDYLEPEKKTILVKGNEVSYYFPEDNQAIFHSVEEEERESNIISLLSGEKSLLEDYSVESAVFPASGSGAEQIKLVPKKEEEAGSYVLLEIDPDTAFINKAVFFDWTGNRQEFIFSNVETGISLPKEVFELNLPPEVEIIKPPSS